MLKITKSVKIHYQVIVKQVSLKADLILSLTFIVSFDTDFITTSYLTTE